MVVYFNDIILALQIKAVVLKNLIALISVSCIVIILAGLKAASSVIVPFLLALFLAVIASSALNLLQKFKIPRIIAFFITCAFFFGIITIVGKIIFTTLADFTTQFPELQHKFQLLMQESIDKINSYGIVYIDTKLIGFDTNVVLATSKKFIKGAGSFLSMSFFIFLMVSFMLFEVDSLRKKIDFLDRSNPRAKVFIATFIYNLKKYLLIKTIASGATGAIIALLLWVLSVPYAALWGVLAFLLNYIPTIGSIVAAIPTLFITLATSDITTAFWVTSVYLFVNILIGNIIEPRFMGEGLGISTILVLVSLLLWGYIFGIAGLFLAIPLTMTMQIALASNPKTKLIAILLSNDLTKKSKKRFN